MTTNTTTFAALEKSTDVAELQATVSLLDCFAQEGTDKIMSLAKIAKQALEADNVQAVRTHLAGTLGTIFDLARDTQDRINDAAEHTGCNHVATVQPIATGADDPASTPLIVGDPVSDLDRLESGIVTAVQPDGNITVQWDSGRSCDMVRGALLLECWARMPAAEAAKVKGAVLTMRARLEAVAA